MRLGNKMNNLIKNPAEDLQKKEVVDFFNHIKSLDAESDEAALLYMGCIEYSRDKFYNSIIINDNVYLHMNEVFKDEFLNQYLKDRKKFSWVKITTKIFNMTDTYVSIVNFPASNYYQWDKSLSYEIFHDNKLELVHLTQLMDIDIIDDLVNSVEDPILWLKKNKINTHTKGTGCIRKRRVLLPCALAPDKIQWPFCHRIKRKDEPRYEKVSCCPDGRHDDVHHDWHCRRYQPGRHL